MNKELALRTFAYLIGHYKTNNETTINKQEIEAMEFILKDNESLEQQCKKQKEYNQHLHNLNNTIFRELLNKRYENKKQKEVINKAVEYINQHWVIDNPVGFKNDLLEILEDKEVSE